MPPRNIRTSAPRKSIPMEIPVVRDGHRSLPGTEAPYENVSAKGRGWSACAAGKIRCATGAGVAHGENFVLKLEGLTAIRCWAEGNAVGGGSSSKQRTMGSRIYKIKLDGIRERTGGKC